MKHHSSRRTALCTLRALSLAALLPATASAQDGAWPNKPLSYIVPFTAGGSTDVIGRTVAQKLAEALKQPVLVDNKPGATAD